MSTIKSFIDEISPSEDEISRISTSWWRIRDILESKLDIFSSSKLTWSYKRNTKISPIDDLDIIFYLKWMWDTYVERKNSDRKECRLWMDRDTYTTHILRDYVSYENNLYYLSPNKILNKIKREIESTYSTTPNINRNWECVTAYLSSYELTIDCMPYTWVNNEDFILIPTSWNDLYRKKTNPDLDLERINSLNNDYNGKIKWIIKIIKYRNAHKNTWPKFKSYVLECIVYQTLKLKDLYYSSYVDILKEVIIYLYNQVNLKILDIPGYDYIYYNLNNEQWKRIQWCLEIMRNNLLKSEDDFISYLRY